jgi:hypothetical protein
MIRGEKEITNETLLTVWKKRYFCSLQVSTFEIQVPKTYLNLIFSFDNVMLISNLYAEQAQLFNEETEEELSEMLSYYIYIQAVFIRDKKYKFYGPTYKMPAGVTSTVDLVKQINNYFKLNKPAGIFTTPVFLDWVDLRFEKVLIKLTMSTIKAWLLLITAKLTIWQNISTLCRVWQEKYLALIIISFLLR